MTAGRTKEEKEKKKQRHKGNSNTNRGPPPGESPRPSLKQEKLAEDKTNEVNTWVTRYLAVGETAMDWAVVTANQSGWFERKR